MEGLHALGQRAFRRLFLVLAVAAGLVGVDGGPQDIEDPAEARACVEGDRHREDLPAEVLARGRQHRLEVGVRLVERQPDPADACHKKR